MEPFGNDKELPEPQLSRLFKSQRREGAYANLQKRSVKMTIDYFKSPVREEADYHPNMVYAFRS
jgi:hypothetical protein